LKKLKKKYFMKISNTIAVLFLGGKSTRMGNLTAKKHKSLLNIGGYSILSHIYTQLRIFGIKEIIFCTGYKSNKIIDYSKKKILKDSNKILNIINKKNIKNTPNIFFSNLTEDNSTSQRIFGARKKIGKKNILVLYGDTLLNLSIKKYKTFLNKNMKLDIALTISNPIEKFGVVKLKDDKIISFSEKKSTKTRWVNSGWIFIKNEIIKKIKNIDLNFENTILTKTDKFNILGFKNKNYYMPIDNITDLHNANIDWKNNKKTWY
tara:strand:- start:1582 stop:2370 length:789 start_codon:yes stop_codon:yes gene_type:complete